MNQQGCIHCIMSMQSGDKRCNAQYNDIWYEGVCFLDGTDPLGRNWKCVNPLFPEFHEHGYTGNGYDAGNVQRHKMNGNGIYRHKSGGLYVSNEAVLEVH